MWALGGSRWRGALRKSLQATLLVTVACASAPARATGIQNSFDGYCYDLRGFVRYDKPLTARTADNGYHLYGTGYCEGEINGGPYVFRESVATGAEGPFRGSCYGGESTAPGTGFIHFTRGNADPADDVVVRMTVAWFGDLTRNPWSDVRYDFQGEVSGSGSGYANFSTPQTLHDNVARCHHKGHSRLPFQATSYTDSPIVSEAPAAAPAPSPPLESPAVEILDRDLGRALSRGVPVRCRSGGSAICRLRTYVSERVARRYGLGSTKIGGGTITVPEGADGATGDITVDRRKRSRLAGARRLRVTLTGAVVAGGRRTPVAAASHLQR